MVDPADEVSPGLASGDLLDPYVWSHSRLSPVFRTSELQAWPGGAVRDGLPGAEFSAKGSLVVGCHHRLHHRESDRERDVHSPILRGFWWAHVGWVISNDFDEYDPRSVAEFLRFPEIRWLDRHHWIPTVTFGAVVALIGGWPAFLWGYVVSTVVLYHSTFAINSLAHLWGTRRFDTPDESRNNFWLALATFGEGWHNNHHYSSGSCRQGERWWELDITYLILRTLSWFGIARELRPFRRLPVAAAIPDVPVKAVL